MKLDLLSCMLKRHMTRRFSFQSFSSNVTIRDCFEKLVQVFKSAGVSESRESASLIIAKALSMKTLHGVDLSMPTTKRLLEHIESMSAKRLMNYPVQYVIEEWDFHSVQLAMRPPVFIPRPETEELVQRALLDPVVQGAERCVEIGCGSGAICITLLKQLPLLRCVAVEWSEEACELTRHNAVANDVADRLNVLNLKFTPDIVDGFASTWGKFDFLISNPPYVRTADMNTLQTEVVRFEDHRALSGGADGMDTIRDILQCSRILLKTGSSIWLEVGSSHPPKVEEFVASNLQLNLKHVQTYEDFSQRPRICQLKVV